MPFRSNSHWRFDGRIALLFAGILAINNLVWVLYVFAHHFESKWSDNLALTATLIGSLWLLKVVNVEVRINRWVWVLIFLLLLLSFLPLVRFLIVRTEYAWFLAYGMLLICSLYLYTNRSSKLSMAVTSILAMAVWVLPYSFESDQRIYFDRLVETSETRRSTIHTILWKNDFWQYVNGRPQFSTIDKHLFYEPLVHPVMHAVDGKRILLIGGDNGESVKEIRKYPVFIDVIPWDQEYSSQMVTAADSLNIISEPILHFLSKRQSTYDAIIIDLPDPITLEVNEFYSVEFYRLCYDQLSERGLLVTQSLSPYLKSGVHRVVQATLDAGGFESFQYHNQIPTLGQWSWTIASKSEDTHTLKQRLSAGNTMVSTKWFNQEAMRMMLSFGKPSFFSTEKAEVNSIANPVLYQRLAGTR